MFSAVKNLQIKSTLPADGAQGISIGSTISAKFTQGVDPSTLHTGTFIVARNSVTPIPGVITYRATQDGEFIAVFTPSTTLDPSSSFQVTLVGRTHPISGDTSNVIRNAAGYPLGQNYTFTFFTGNVNIQPPQIIQPLNYSAIRTPLPVFAWTRINNVDSYNLEIGTTSLMEPLYFPPTSSIIYPISIPNPATSPVAFTPDQEFGYDQQYYWRVRTVMGISVSAWSELQSFFLSDPTRSNIYDAMKPELPPVLDSVPTVDDPSYSEIPFSVISVDPVDGTIGDLPDRFTVKFSKNIDPASIDTARIKIVGTKIIQSDYNISSMGDVTIQDIYVDPDDPTSLIIIPVGGGASPATLERPMMTAEDFTDLFRDILVASGYQRMFAQDFLATVDGDLYVNTLRSVLSIGRAPSYQIGRFLSTSIHATLPSSVSRFEIKFACDVPIGTNLVIELSTDDGVTPVVDGGWTYDDTVDIQSMNILNPLPGTAMDITIKMRTSDTTKTPELYWFVVLFNDGE